MSKYIFTDTNRNRLEAHLSRDTKGGTMILSFAVVSSTGHTARNLSAALKDNNPLAFCYDGALARLSLADLQLKPKAAGSESVDHMDVAFNDLRKITAVTIKPYAQPVSDNFTMDDFERKVADILTGLGFEKSMAGKVEQEPAGRAREIDGDYYGSRGSRLPRHF
jgi:hypothetical protein